MNAAVLINQTSGNVEYYTPDDVLFAVKMFFHQRIDLDPASSETANELVGAERFFAEPKRRVNGEIGGLPVYQWDGQGGLDQKWEAEHLWMNHPFGGRDQPCSSACDAKRCKKRGYHIASELPGNEDWVEKLVHEFAAGRTREALCITYACTSEAWFQPLLRRPQCFLSPRTNYRTPDGKTLPGVTKGSVVTYFGGRVRSFRSRFADLGVVKVEATA